MQTLAPVILSAMTHFYPDATVSTAMTHLQTIVKSPELDGDAKKYARMIYDLVVGESAATALKTAGLLDKVDPAADDLQAVHKTFGPACMIEMALPVSAHFLLKCALATSHGHFYVVILYCIPRN